MTSPKPKNNPHRPTALTGYQPQPCRAHSKTTGKQCGNTAEPGAVVCRYHGGAAPQVRRKAALRLLELVDPSIATLAEVMMSKTNKPADRIRAADSILDRAGIPRAQTMDISVSQDVLIQRLRAMRDRAAETTDGEPMVVSGVVEPPTGPTEDVSG